MPNSFQNDTILSTGTGTDNGEDGEGDGVEEFVYNLMGKTGLLSELKSRIALFIQESGGMVPGVSVIPSRADPIILQHIFEYLQWVGMKNTSSLLLTESPVNIDNMTSLEDHEEPALCALFDTIDRGDKFSSVNRPGSNQIDITPLNNKTYTSKFLGTPLSPKGKDESFFSAQREQKKGKEFGERYIYNNEESFGLDDASMHSEPVESPIVTPKGSSGSVAAVNLENESIKNKSNGEPSKSNKKIEEDDDTISDLIDSVQLDDNTQDLSIDSDSRGMSSCEHVVNLK